MRQRRRDDRGVLSNVWGSFGGNGIPGSELYIFENNLEEEEEYITAKHLGFGVRLPGFKSQFCHLMAV